MSHLKDEIKDEEKGHEHYEALSRKDPKNRALFKKMADDEESHEKHLKKIEKKELREKALKKKSK